MSRFFPVLSLFCVLVGAVIGWNVVPHYRTPADGGELRLREKAAGYYQATRLFDYLGMAQHYTPAKQTVEKSELLKESNKHLDSFRQLPADNQASLKVSAESITPESIEMELIGDWAKTWGSCVYPTANSKVTVNLEEQIWVKSGGDWWIYTWTKPEIAAYGNPPGDLYEYLSHQRMMDARQVTSVMQQPKQPQVPASSDAANTSENSPPAENESNSGEDE